jgi:nucleotide-binding universal stress UspA family protein
MSKLQRDSERDTLKHYLKQIKSLFPVYGKHEKRFLTDFEKDIQDYLQSDSEASVESAISHFGSPADIIQDYMDNIDIDDLIKRARFAKTVRAGVIIIVLIVAIVAATLSVTYYYQSKEAQEALASIVEIEIDEE